MCEKMRFSLRKCWIYFLCNEDFTLLTPLIESYFHSLQKFSTFITVTLSLFVGLVIFGKSSPNIESELACPQIGCFDQRTHKSSLDTNSQLTRHYSWCNWCCLITRSLITFKWDDSSIQVLKYSDKQPRLWQWMKKLKIVGYFIVFHSLMLIKMRVTVMMTPASFKFQSYNCSFCWMKIKVKEEEKCTTIKKTRSLK